MSLVLLLLVFWFALTLLMAAGTLFLQGYFNETPPEMKDLLWRAPAASGVVTVFLALWVSLVVGDPDRYAPITEYSSEETTDAPTQIKAVVNGNTITYKFIKEPRGPGYYRSNEYGRMPARPEAIILTEDGKEIRFEPRKDEKSPRFLRYYDDEGRWTEEGSIGQLTTSRGDQTFVYYLLLLLHVGVWFAAAWPLLRYSVWQSVTIALVSWATMLFFLMPPIWRAARAYSIQRDKEERQQTELHHFDPTQLWQRRVKCESISRTEMTPTALPPCKTGT